jgi:hypothetical protein
MILLIIKLQSVDFNLVQYLLQTKDFSDTKTSKEYYPTSNTSEERRISVFENPLLIIIMVI